MTNLADELFATVRAATSVLYPEARIPETPMPKDLMERTKEFVSRCLVALGQHENEETIERVAKKVIAALPKMVREP